MDLIWFESIKEVKTFSTLTQPTKIKQKVLKSNFGNWFVLCGSTYLYTAPHLRVTDVTKTRALLCVRNQIADMRVKATRPMEIFCC